MTPAAFTPFAGLPTILVVLFTVALVVIGATLLWTGLLFVRAQRTRRHPPPVSAVGADDFTWVFVVPALNEERTIRDSIARLLAVQVAHRHIVVVDDGSEDRTADVLAAISDPGVTVLRREPPEARQGKAAALNHAYRELRDLLGDSDPERVVVVIVDADGRLAPDSPAYVAAHLAEPRVGGVQALVRIYNRNALLTWLQDVEFSVYAFLYQAGRTGWGTAGMGGNGQFNRLSALHDVAGENGPWRDRLTEDQDLGLRLIGVGWEGRQDLRAVVEQQGLPNLRRLFRQRTRWSQGNLQAMSLIGTVVRAPVSLMARIEALAYLLMPLWQGIVGISFLAALVLLIIGEASLWDQSSYWQLAFIYVLGVGGVIMGCVARGAPAGVVGILRGVLVAQVYALYSWLLWPVLARAATRQLIRRRGWAKTERVDPTTDAPTSTA